MPLSSPGEADQTLTQWTMQTKGTGIIYYFCLIHLKQQQLKGTPMVKAYSLQWLDSVITTTALYTNTDSFPTSDFIGTSG